MLLAHTPAPNFSLPNQDGKIISLSDYLGKWVLVYFYPKDDTPGCTVEACSLRDNLPDFDTKKAIILGISTDNIESHKKFHTKHKLNFDLLSDTEKKVVSLYQVWQEKKFMGRVYYGITRSSYLIDPQGNIKKVYEKVSPLSHSKQVLADLA